jgi:hypothetical protein
MLYEVQNWEEITFMLSFIRHARAQLHVSLTLYAFSQVENFGSTSITRVVCPLDNEPFREGASLRSKTCASQLCLQVLEIPGCQASHLT